MKYNKGWEILKG